jgi:hypothetical protein
MLRADCSRTTATARTIACARAVGGARAILAGIAGLVLATVTACSGTSTPVLSSPSPTGSATLEELTQAFLAYAQCARTHGMPDLPDPIVDQQGNDAYPPLNPNGSPHWTRSVLSGCASLWDHVHDVRARYDASHGLAARAQNTLSAAQQLALAQCIRRHGFPNYPDPRPGTITPPPGFQKPNLSQAAIAAIQVCEPQVSHG